MMLQDPVPYVDDDEQEDAGGHAMEDLAKHAVTGDCCIMVIRLVCALWPTYL